MVSILTEGLVERGHEVTLFATGDAITKAKLEIIHPHSLEESRIYDPIPATLVSLTRAFKQSHKFDLTHINTEPAHIGFPFSYFNSVPSITTVHTALSFIPQKVLEEYRNNRFVSVSDNQRRGQSDINFVRTVHNGISIKDFPFSQNRGDYLLFVGRLTLEKGPHFAIEAARKLKMPLIIAGNIPPYPLAIEYFNAYISPGLENGLVEWVGEVGPEERNKLMKGAKCLLNPITWREPFGFVMVEAMATGCPVITFKRGSTPEVVIDKKTGFLVESAKEMAKAVKRVDAIDPKDCREHVKKNFSADKMVASYEDLYKKILSKEV
jgi:glycosyltransferase involved in cell wall biosynthesis